MKPETLRYKLSTNFFFFTRTNCTAFAETRVEDCVRAPIVQGRYFFLGNKKRPGQRKRLVFRLFPRYGTFSRITGEIWCNALIHSTPRSFFTFLHRITSCSVTSGICTKQNRGPHACISSRSLILDTKLSFTVVILQLSENSNIQERTEDETCSKPGHFRANDIPNKRYLSLCF